MKYDFILDGMRFSYSSVNSYVTCPGCFKLSYIDVEDRIGNAFSDFGNLVHSTLEKYFKGELQIDQLAEYYEDNYEISIINPFPPYPQGMSENYYNAGLEFFENLFTEITY